MNLQLLNTQLACSRRLGFDLTMVEQGSKEWQRSRAGVITASKAYFLLMGRSTAGRQTYMSELVAQVATGRLPEEISAKPLAWGKDHEEAARGAYSAHTLDRIEETAFIYQDLNMRIGISPDGLILGQDKGLELKCPWASATWINFAGFGMIKKEEIAQVQFSLLVTGFDCWDFAKFDPRNINCKKLHMTTIYRDEVMIEKMRQGVAEFIEDMDQALEELGLEFGQQWKGDHNDK
jgi:predicted phage-related endonuclease